MAQPAWVPAAGLAVDSEELLRVPIAIVMGFPPADAVVPHLQQTRVKEEPQEHSVHSNPPPALELDKQQQEQEQGRGGTKRGAFNSEAAEPGEVGSPPPSKRPRLSKIPSAAAADPQSAGQQNGPGPAGPTLAPHIHGQRQVLHGPARSPLYTGTAKVKIEPGSGGPSGSARGPSGSSDNGLSGDGGGGPDGGGGGRPSGGGCRVPSDADGGHVGAGAGPSQAAASPAHEPAASQPPSPRQQQRRRQEDVAAAAAGSRQDGGMEVGVATQLGRAGNGGGDGGAAGSVENTAPRAEAHQAEPAAVDPPMAESLPQQQQAQPAQQQLPNSAPAAAAQPPPKPTTLLGLQEQLDQDVLGPQQQEQAQEQAQQQQRQQPDRGGLLVIELDEATLGGPLPSDGAITVRAGRVVTLRNGKLLACVVVEEGATLRLERMVLKGTPGQRPVADAGPSQCRFHDPAVVFANGAGSRVVLRNSRVVVRKAAGREEEEQDGSLCAVLARAGGKAVLSDCVLRGAPNAGLAAEGACSRARALRVRAHRCDDGFRAVDGGRLVAKRCVAARNTGKGFVAEGQGRVVASGGCVARRNGESGFCAWGLGSSVKVGDGCRSTDNRDAGFLARDGGELSTGDGCEARDNCDEGFIAQGHGARLSTGDNCMAVGNRSGGFLAVQGGRLSTGGGCKARKNQQSGYSATGLGSQLFVGPRCVGSSNAEAGFLAQAHGRVEVGPGCTASHNLEEGFVALGGTLVLGAGCEASENFKDGFAACNGGTLDGGAGGSVSEDNVLSGWCCEDKLSKLIAGPGSQAIENGGSGFVAQVDSGGGTGRSRDGGSVKVAAGSRSEGNRGVGYRVSGRGALMDVAEGCVARKNEGGREKEEDGGKFGPLVW